MQKKVLIVEDDEASRYIYGTMLRHSGFGVRQARDAQTALELLRQERPDLIVADIGLPGMDGFELTQTIRSDTATADIPIVVVTVHIFPEDQARAERAGCTLFLKKPLEPSRLAEQVQRLLGEPVSTPIVL